MNKYSHAILGGTFDHFHAGHKHFLSHALAKSEKLTIGLTVDEFSKYKALHHSIENYETREKNLLEFLSENNYSDKARIIPIKDPFGTSLTDDSIEAIFVTEHGLANANLINTKLVELGKAELVIENVPFLLDSYDEIISSTRIRAGEIDRDGNSYMDIFKPTLLLPEDLREEVRVLGEVKGNLEDIKELNNTIFLIAVGDVVSENLINMGRRADVSVIDLKINRKEIASSEFDANLITANVANNSGTIDSLAVETLDSAISETIKTKRPQVVKIDGEEDLLAIPAILLAPLDSIIVYGLPGKGIVAVKITEEKKEEIKKLAEKFNR